LDALLFYVKTGELMGTLRMVEGNMDDAEYRRSFFCLLEKSFHFTMEEWYQKGFYQGRYFATSILDEDRVVSNVARNAFDLVVEGRPVRALQLASVCTDPEYRGRGLLRQLMEDTLRRFLGEYDLIYLFANDTVLDFYPRFGFQKKEEQRCVMETMLVRPQAAPIVKLVQTDPAHREILWRLLRGRRPVSNILGVHHDEWPLNAVCFGDSYLKEWEHCYLPQRDCAVLLERKDGVLHIYDVLSEQPFVLDDVVEELILPQDRAVEFHFIPELTRYTCTCEPYRWEDTTLFYQGKVPLRGKVLFSPTNHT
jgi:predicted N-acetyltransferase YhbS